MIYLTYDVWKRLPAGRLARYRCFQVRPGGGFCVQSKDFFEVGSLSVSKFSEHERQFLELLSEEAPDSRSTVYATLEEAIANHDEEFAN